LVHEGVSTKFRLTNNPPIVALIADKILPTVVGGAGARVGVVEWRFRNVYRHRARFKYLPEV